MFDRLLETECADFKVEVKSERNAWVKDPSSVDTNKVIGDLINLFTNYKGSGDWDKIDENKAAVIALATELKKERAKNNQQGPGDKSGQPRKTPAGVPNWKFTNVGATTKCPTSGDTFKWCPHHGKKDGKGQRGMYMPADHDHKKWEAEKKAKNDAWNAKKKAGKRKADGDDKGAQPDPKKGGGKLALAKSFHSALTSKVQLSDAEAKDLIDKALAEVDDEDPSKV